MINQIKLKELYLYKSRVETFIMKFVTYNREYYTFVILKDGKWEKGQANKLIAEEWKLYLNELTEEKKLELL